MIMRWCYYIYWHRDNLIRLWSHTPGSNIIDEATKDKILAPLISITGTHTIMQDRHGAYIVCANNQEETIYVITSINKWTGYPKARTLFLLPETHPWFNYGLIFKYFNDKQYSFDDLGVVIAKAITADLKKWL